MIAFCRLGTDPTGKDAASMPPAPALLHPEDRVSVQYYSKRRIIQSHLRPFTKTENLRKKAIKAIGGRMPYNSNIYTKDDDKEVVAIQVDDEEDVANQGDIEEGVDDLDQGQAIHDVGFDVDDIDWDDIDGVNLGGDNEDGDGEGREEYEDDEH
uniref:Uncharacterized protein n=1 Tax=Nelumbo nucifera TaxID=4432 RepID=A0A822ZC69_NELNU|nr:TPA_asm: hypothetical protein HUJ06_002044 [Nelumbo nucifera]